MADVFISYAREDRAFVQTLVAELRKIKISVWWDEDLRPGQRYALEIEKEIDTAPAFVLILSEASVQSEFVFAEYYRAHQRNKLIPVRIDEVEAPLLVNVLQSVDLRDWTRGNKDSRFQDLWAQIIALRDSVSEASAVPREDSAPQRNDKPVVSAVPNEPPPDVSAEKDDLSSRSPDAMPTGTGGAVGAGRPATEPGKTASSASLGGWIAPLIAFGTLASLFVSANTVTGFFGPTLALALSTAAFLVIIFRDADHRLPAHIKVMIARWLRPRAAASPLWAGRAFFALFQAVYGRSHWSLRCMIASAVTTLGVYFVLLFMLVPADRLIELVSDLYQNGVSEPRSYDFGQTSDFLTENAGLFFISVPVINLVADYIALLFSRRFLLYSATGTPVYVTTLLSIAASAIVFIIFLPAGPFLIGAMIEGAYFRLDYEKIESLSAISFDTWHTFSTLVSVGWPSEVITVLSGEGDVARTALVISFLTTFTTSLWLIATLILGPLIRFLALIPINATKVLRPVLDVRARPVEALGYVAASVVLLAAPVVDAATETSAPVLAHDDEEPLRFQVFRDCDVCPEMVMLPGGTFTAGDWGASNASNGRQTRDVQISAFAIGRYEVTFREWDRCVADGVCTAVPRLGNFRRGDQGWGRGSRPVITVSVKDARDFVRWVNDRVSRAGVVYRLPTEVEWEYAARANTTESYSFPEQPSLHGCLYMNGRDETEARRNPGVRRRLNCSDGYAFTAPVGSYRPNRFGLYDMHGNVFEWTSSCYQNAATDEAENAEASASSTDCARYVYRGGSWLNPPTGRLHPATRSDEEVGWTDIVLGFRVVRLRAESASE